MSIDVSAVGAVYSGVKPEWLHESLESLLIGKNLLREVILVVDGYIPQQLEDVVDHYKREITVLRLNKNSGLANALNCGIKEASSTYILRFDSDDINCPDRVPNLCKFLQSNPDIDVLGSWVQEFGFSKQLRKTPLKHSEIIKYLGFRVAFNHPSVVYKKSVWEKIGGYRNDIFPEDYVFWLSARKLKMCFHNIPDVLVLMRTNEDFLERRRGYRYFKNEILLLRFSFKTGLLTFFEVMKQLIFKSIWRLLPLPVFKKLFTLIRKYR